MTKQLIDYLPNSYVDIYQISSLFDVLQDELDDVYSALDTFKDNLFLTSANDETLTKYTKLLGLNGSSTEEKRNLVTTLISKLPPFNIYTLETYLNLYVSTFQITINNDFTIDIAYRTGGTEVDPNSILDSLYTLIPANMAINFSYTYANYDTLTGLTWGDIASKTWRQIIY